MLTRKAKAVFYFAAGPLMKVNGHLYRIFRAPREGTLKVHLGPGQRNYLEGWINLDANMFTGKCDVWADLRNPLPFHDRSVDAVYSYHVVEHLPNLILHFQEVFRCLKPCGIYRVGVPNGDAAIRKFLEEDANWFPDFPDKRRSLGGRLENFIFCRQEHLTLLTYSYLEELMMDAGFRDLRVCQPAEQTRNQEVFGDCLRRERETDREWPHTLIVEAERPGPAP